MDHEFTAPCMVLLGRENTPNTHHELPACAWVLTLFGKGFAGSALL